MIYLAQSQFRVPEGLSAETWAELAEKEFQYGVQARKDGKLLGIWRIVGINGAAMIWQADDNDEMHRLLSGLPFFPYADITVTPLATHPSDVRLAAPAAAAAQTSPGES
ncbi:MAG: muconolactone delta-isomerase [Subtercola sp.]|jgi:muconolactone D-isomerase|nr:muconolactone delta-isomerase [Subtercola sp.]